MPDEPIINPTEKEATPEWAMNLTEKMENLSNKLSELLTPPQMEEEPTNEIPVPQPPEPPQVEEVETPLEEPQPEPKKKKSLLGWLL